MADNDLTAAVQILKLGESAPVETICFHAQQCVEKYCKAILVFRSIPFPRTHNIRTLMIRIPAKLRPNLTEELQDRLTEYAVVTRYPDGGLEITLAAAKKAVALARRLRREVRRVLPGKALRRKKR